MSVQCCFKLNYIHAYEMGRPTLLYTCGYNSENPVARQLTEIAAKHGSSTNKHSRSLLYGQQKGTKMVEMEKTWNVYLRNISIYLRNIIISLIRVGK